MAQRLHGSHRHESWPTTRMQFLRVAILLSICCFAQGRQNGDPLEIGEEVRIHIFVEKDYYFTLLACGENQCGGVRVEGLDQRGMGFSTFVSRPNRPGHVKWILKEDIPFGSGFKPGKEFTLHVLRSSERQMLVWVEGKENRKASVTIRPGTVRLTSIFKQGIYTYLSAEDRTGQKALERKETCVNETPPAPIIEPGDDVVEISMGCRYDEMDKVQSMCVVYLNADGVKGMQEVYRSRLARNEYDPRLEKTVKLPFRFHEQQNLLVAVYNSYMDCVTPPDEEQIRMVQTPLATVNRQGKVELKITGDDAAKYFVRFSLNCDEKVTLSLSGKDIPATGNVYLRVFKSPPSNVPDKNSGYVLVAETKKVPRDIGLILWDEITLSVEALCDNDYNRSLKVYALAEQVGESTLIGYFWTTLSELTAQPNNSFVLIADTEDPMGGSHNTSGTIFIGDIPRSPTFSQYVAVGFELLGTLQIDFTGSNDAVSPSLHDISSPSHNKYEVAIQGVGEVVENFISDGVYKAYGYGADLPGGGGATAYDFHVNISSSTPDCQGVKGVLRAYRECLPQISMSGPTLAAPGLRKVIDIARQYQDGSKYLIHVLLTDGLLNDGEETRQAIVEASRLPISIIIVGIGNADFGLLESISNQTAKAASSQSAVPFWDETERGARDIVQFVAMREFHHTDGVSLKNSIRQHVLAKIPPQYLEYMKLRKIPPKPPKNSAVTRECRAPPRTPSVLE